jgi:SAM-dependent methyltransferase
MSSSERNLDYYEAASAARDDYWRYMAAPRMRVARIAQLVRSLAPATLVDLGCGNGSLLDELARAMPGAQLAGIDLSPRQIDANRLRAPEIEWTTADLQQPIDVRRTYHAVVASEVIEHLDEPRMLLVNARRLAERSGHLILTTQSGPVRETERRVGHVRHFSLAQIGALLVETGWTPVRVWNEGWPFHDLSKWWANRDADASMNRFGGGGGYGASERLICLLLRAAFRVNSRTRGAQLFAVARNDS